MYFFFDNNKKKLWTPAKLTTKLWLDANDSSTITLNGSTVSQWLDKSGNSINVSQDIASAQPTYSASGFNGKPTLSFDGGDNLVSTLNHGLTGDPEFSLFIAQTMPYTSLQTYISWGGTGAGQSYHWICTAATASDRMIGFANSTDLATFTPTNPTNPNIMSICRTGTTKDAWTVHQNGTSLSLTTSGEFAVNVVNSPFYVGSWVNQTFKTTALMSEIIVVPSNITNANRTKVEGYLSWKWGLQSNLANGHPYKSSPPKV